MKSNTKKKIVNKPNKDKKNKKNKDNKDKKNKKDNKDKKKCIICKKIIYGRQLCCSCYLSANNVSTTYNCVCSSGMWCDYCYGEIDLFD